VIADGEEIFRVYKGNFWVYSIRNAETGEKQVHKYKTNWENGTAQYFYTVSCANCGSELGHYLSGYLDSKSNTLVEYKLFNQFIWYIWTDARDRTLDSLAALPARIDKRETKPTEQLLEQKLKQLNITSVSGSDVVESPAARELMLSALKLQAEREERKEDDICPICMDRQRDCVLCPCGHRVCDTCAKQLKLCPLCNGAIVMRVHMY